MSDLNIRISLELLTAALQREAKLRHALKAISFYAREQKYNINCLTSSPPMNELGMDLRRMADKALAETPEVSPEAIVKEMS